MKYQPTGQVLIGALALLCVVSISVPAIIKYMQNEGHWTVKQQQTTRSFEAAESAVEEGHQQLLLSTTTWQNLQAGTPPAGYHFDQVYNGPNGTHYAIQMVAGPAAGQATIIGVARGASSSDIRAVQAIYSVPGAAEAAIYGVAGVTISGVNPRAEWGPVLSPSLIDGTSRFHPRFIGGGAILGWDNQASPPNTDNLHWWSYQAMPPAPQIDLDAYKSAAFSVDGSQPLGSGPAGSIYYYSGDLDPGVGTYIDGTLIVVGSLSLHGTYGSGALVALVPPDAWKEYGQSAATWANYRANFDGGAPFTFPGLDSTYQTVGKTANLTNVFVHGFLYVGNDLQVSPSAIGTIHGSLFAATTANLNGSTTKVYYDPTVIPGIKVKNTTLSRKQWQEINCHWSGVFPACP